MNELIEMLKRHEALRLKPYRDTNGKLTIGVGRNLDDVGISEEEALAMLSTDIRCATNSVQSLVPSFDSLGEVRQAVLIDMCFNMGRGGLAKFVRMLAAVADGDFNRAANEMHHSAWATQVGGRAAELEAMMRTGEWQ